MNAVRFRIALSVVAPVILMAGWAGTASAQSGDDPSPCASITDNKSRLQCYDAQEALKARRRAPGAVAVPTPPPPSVAAVPAMPPVPPAAPPMARAPEPAAPSATPPQAGSPSAEFGLQGEALARKRAAEAPKDVPKATEQLVAKVTAVTGRGKGDYRIELDNGQLWMESQRTGGEAPATGETVTIRPGLLGSYFLEREVGGLALRVKRVK